MQLAPVPQSLPRASCLSCLDLADTSHPGGSRDLALCRRFAWLCLSSTPEHLSGLSSCLPTPAFSPSGVSLPQSCSLMLVLRGAFEHCSRYTFLWDCGTILFAIVGDTMPVQIPATFTAFSLTLTVVGHLGSAASVCLK